MPKYTANIENERQLRNKKPIMEPDKLFRFLRVFVVVVVAIVVDDVVLLGFVV